MKIIAAIAGADGVLEPAEPLPDMALKVICDGSNYTVYEDGDVVPGGPPSGAIAVTS